MNPPVVLTAAALVMAFMAGVQLMLGLSIKKRPEKWIVLFWALYAAAAAVYFAIMAFRLAAPTP
jgi:hypothetical protein